MGSSCSGHGTHCAGTIAGTQYGVAKAATIVAVQALPSFLSLSRCTAVSATRNGLVCFFSLALYPG